MCSKSAGRHVRGTVPRPSRKGYLSPKKKTQEKLVLFFLWTLYQDVMARTATGILSHPEDEAILG